MTHESYIYKKGEETSEKSEELEDKTKVRTREEGGYSLLGRKAVVGNG